MVPSPTTLAMIGGAFASAFVGAAIGYWLGKRRAERPARPIRHVASTVDSMMELAPVAMHLLANPLVRALALRMVLRQLKQRMAF
jgi:integral membrane sensor domain MASE1